MVNEEDAIRKFVARQLIQCSDLSSLTLGVLRKRYLEHAGRESLSIKDRQLMKTIVEEELLKMQESSDDEPLVKFVDKKRKRVDDEDDGDEGLTNEEMERTKRSRHEVSSPDSPDSGIVKAMNEEGQKEVEDESDHDKNADDDSEEEKNTGRKVKQQKKNIRGNKQSKKREVQKKQAKIIDSEEEEELECSDEEKLKTAPAKGKEKREDSGSEEKTHNKQTKNSSSESASGSEDKKGRSKEKIQKKRNEMKKKTHVEIDAVKEVERQVFGSSSESEEEKNEMTKTGKSSDPESESESEEECVANSSIRKEEKETVKKHLGEVEEDSDSSSLPSLEDEEEQEKGKKEGKQKSVTNKKRSEERENTARAKDEENKTVARLKRYISLCGVRRNYKKLLDGCRSVKAKVAVLKKELEELGVEGQPSIEKCKKARLKREEAQEVAELDVSNIISTQGRPKRKAAAAVWPPPLNVSPPRFVYKHAVDSDSDSEDSHTNRGRKRAGAWSNLQGIISDDGESD